MHILKTLCSRVCVKETSKSKLRLKKKKKKRKQEREEEGVRKKGKEKKIKKSIYQFKLPPPSLVPHIVKSPPAMQ